MDRRHFLLRCLGGLSALIGIRLWSGIDLDVLSELVSGGNQFGTNGYYRIVVMGDPHLPVREREFPDSKKQQKIVQAKYDVIQDINNWHDVDEIAVVGDIAAQLGVDAEYSFAKKYFSRLEKPVSIMAGNHDYVYEDEFSASGRLVHGNADLRRQKLRRFKKFVELQALYYNRQVGPYQLIYLSPDSMESRYLTEISEQQMNWFKGLLKQNPHQPTIVFFHAPLKGTLLNYNRTVNTPAFVAQPADMLDAVIRSNPQIVLWVSGHTHTPATNESYALTKENTYAGQLLNVHTTDMDREVIWTNSLYLYQDKIVIRTFNHSTRKWEEKLDRAIRILWDTRGRILRAFI